MAQPGFLQVLQCPYCGGELGLDGPEPAPGEEIDFGTLRCRCYRYGIVLGIAVLRQDSPPNDNRDPVVAALDEGDHARAIDILLAREIAPPSRRRAAFARILTWLRGGSRGGDCRKVLASDDLRSALRRWRPDGYGEYLEYRYGNPSLLAAVPVIAAMTRTLAKAGGKASPPWALDLGCGIGHTTHLLKSLAPAMQVVAADRDFLNLVLAKHYVAPDANFVCFDAEVGLPFRNGVFDLSFSLDCVHYIRGKRKLAGELRRTSRPHALYALSHLHNAERTNPNQGIPLTANGYRKVFEPLGGGLYAEPELLESFSRSGSLALGLAAEKDRTDVADAFVYLSLGEGESASTRIDRYMATSLPCFSLNGIYDITSTDGAVELRLRWPSEELRDECCAGPEPLKERVAFASSFVDAVLDQRFHELPQDTFEGLIRSFVIVPQHGNLRPSASRTENQT